MGLWVCHKRKALFSIIEVDIYLFANNERMVESGRKALQIVFLAINRNATQNIQTVQTTVKKLPWNSCFEVNCRTLHAPRQEEWDKQDGGYLRYKLHCAIKKWSVAVSASKVLQIGSWAIHGNATQDMHKVWDLWKEMAIRSVLSIGECVLTVKQQFFLDTQMSLAPTHVRCKSVRPSVRPSVRDTFGFPISGQ